MKNRFFPEIHGNFGFGCMRLPMNGGKVDYDEFSRMADAFIDAGLNYFDTAPNCGGYWMWERMQKAGHAEVCKMNNGEMWHLTRRGLDWLEMKLDMKIYDEED